MSTPDDTPPPHCAPGGLTIKMLQRLADLDASAHPPGPPPEQDVPLSIPKKTKLYVEQTQREREQVREATRRDVTACNGM